jgi:hypothetical protein
MDQARVTAVQIDQREWIAELSIAEAEFAFEIKSSTPGSIDPPGYARAATPQA